MDEKTKQKILNNLQTVQTCTYKGSHDECFNALNDLRRHGCNGFCVATTRAWIDLNYPNLSNDEVTKLLEELLTAK